MVVLISGGDNLRLIPYMSDVLVMTVIARNRINGVCSLFFRDRILRFGENMSLSPKILLSNFKVVVIQNSVPSSFKS